VIGQNGGAESITLLATQMPAHNHTVGVSTLNGASDSPALGYPAKNASGVPEWAAAANSTLAAAAISNAGGGQPHENRPPYLALNWIISLVGIYPSRS
jgi:microcystin-dependent protein